MSFTFAGAEDNAVYILEELYLKGWLEHTDNSYGMHPVIAENIRKKHPSEQEFETLWQILEENLCFSFQGIGITDSSQADTAFLL